MTAYQRFDPYAFVAGKVQEPPVTPAKAAKAAKAEPAVSSPEAAAPAAAGWTAEDWQAFFGERAGIAEFNGHLPRPRAEDAAFEHCVAEWRWRNLTPSEPGRCCMCGCDDDSGDLLLPHGMESTGHAWLHTRCWQPWQDGRRAAAIAALAAAGVYAPGGTR